MSQPLLRSVVFDGWDFGLRLPYMPGASVVLTRPDYRGWYLRQGRFKGWWRLSALVVDTRLEGLLAELAPVCEACGVRVDRTVLSEMLLAARSRPDPSCFAEGLQISLAPLEGGAVLLQAAPFHPGVVAVAKAMHGTYLPAMKAWRLQRSSPAYVRHNLVESLRLDVSQVRIADVLYGLAAEGAGSGGNGDAAITLQGAPPPAGSESASGAADGLQDDKVGQVYLAATDACAPKAWDWAAVEQLLQRYSLRTHQQLGVKHLIRQTGALLADDMGLGKTRQAVVAADLVAEPDQQVLIACPASLVLNWRNEILAVDPQARIGIQRAEFEARWLVCNYEQLHKLKSALAKVAVLIVDEAHVLKEPSAAKTRLTFEVAAQIPHRMLLTGTPIMNREAELHTLLRLSGHALGQMPQGQFVSQFAGSSEFRQSLHAQLGDWMLRRSKDEVLRELQGKQRQLLTLPLNDTQTTEYEEILRDPALIGFQRMGTLRQWLEQEKLPWVRERIGLLGADDKLIVFCEFKQSVREVVAHCEQLGIECVSLTGEDSTRQRQAAIDRFQQDPAVRVFVGTTMAAGTGITLTAANYVCFASLPWTPGLLEQAEDRAFRLGQLRLVIVQIPLLAGTIDQQLWELLLHKKTVASEVIEPEKVLLGVLEAALAE
ncbi:DEAD/DEAH box helicase [Parachitinimonas caeni]|uniref:DEAD/DEAH box helicase n=1 Tax=Parachitinimonas caeni TaxID=3031301 RepID=A0ABT7E4U9_9NEIS|nr:DEAD/DEAH box helicase [Parachitinimonas caeni]MDK2126475.1 DEAD/DEAH box helicase [Parachitinimonas caeni]